MREVDKEQCPRCGSDSFEQWTIGRITPYRAGDRDNNRRTCSRCGCKWYRRLVWVLEVVDDERA